MNRIAVALVVLTVLVALPAAVSGGAVATGLAPSADDPGTVSSTEPTTAIESVQTEDNGTDGGDNETVRHRHPDDQRTNEDDLGGWLADQLAIRLGDSTIQITDGQYETARSLVGDEYDEQLDQYIEVTGASEEEEETLREVGDKKEELANVTEEFEETREAYEQAVAEGDTERARELARELDALAEEIRFLTSELEVLLADSEEILDEDFIPVIEELSELRAETLSVRAAVLSETFTETELVVETDQQSVSFLDPLVATGKLRTVGGEPVANQSIRVTVAGEPRTVQTNETGAFTLEYRPTSISLDTESLSVRYRPATDSEYLASEASVNVTIEQVEPTLLMTATPPDVRFGDEVRIGGELNVQGVPVEGVTLDVILGEQQIGTVQVSDGSFDGTVEIPASVPDGEQPLTVRLPFEGQALAGITESQPVSVLETGTRVSMTATPVSETRTRSTSAEIRVTGTLETVDGHTVGGDAVEIRLGDTVLTTVTTDTNGAFAETLTVPTAEADEAITVTVAYQGSGNLAPSHNESTVVLPPVQEGPSPGQADGAESGGDTPDDDGESIRERVGGSVESIQERVDNLSRLQTVLLGGLIFLLLSGGAVWWYRRRSVGGPSDVLTGDEAATTEDDETTAETTVTESLFEQAREQLQSGQPDQAVQTMYGVVRSQLESQLGITGPLTHWEFWRACQDVDEELGADATESLRSVTEIYEQATFGIDPVAVDDGETALERARRLCGIDGDGSESGAVADD